MTEIKSIAKAFSDGDVKKAFEIKETLESINEEREFELGGVVRQAIISFLKKGDVENARKTEKLFKLSKEDTDDTVKQAVLSIFRDGDIKTITELKKDLPIPSSMAEELIAYCSSWKKTEYADCMRLVFA